MKHEHAYAYVEAVGRELRVKGSLLGVGGGELRRVVLLSFVALAAAQLHLHLSLRAVHMHKEPVPEHEPATADWDATGQDRTGHDTLHRFECAHVLSPPRLWSCSSPGLPSCTTLPPSASPCAPSGTASWPARNAARSAMSTSRAVRLRDSSQQPAPVVSYSILAATTRGRRYGGNCH